VQNGIDFTPTTTADASLSLDDVTISGTSGNGLAVGATSAAQKLNVLVRDSTIIGSRGTFGIAGERGIGVSADTGAHVWLTGATIFDNLIGIKTFARSGAAGVIDSYCDNQIGGNVDDGTAPNRLCPNLPPVIVPAPDPVIVTNTNTVTTREPVVVTEKTAAQCVVPDLRGLTLAVARRMLRATNCALGVVTRKRTAKRKLAGSVITQKTAAGKKLRAGAKVAVTIGRR